MRRWRRTPRQEGRRTDERLFAVAAWREAPYFTDAERAALPLGEAVTRLADRPDPVPDDIYQESAKHFDARALAGLILWIATTNLFSRVNAATRQIAGARPCRPLMIEPCGGDDEASSRERRPRVPSARHPRAVTVTRYPNVRGGGIVALMRILERKLAHGVVLMVDAEPSVDVGGTRLAFAVKVENSPENNVQEQCSTITAQEAMVLLAGVSGASAGEDRAGWVSPWSPAESQPARGFVFRRPEE